MPPENANNLITLELSVLREEEPGLLRLSTAFIALRCCPRVGEYVEYLNKNVEVKRVIHRVDKPILLQCW